jgi:hypothetical protein
MTSFAALGGRTAVRPGFSLGRLDECVMSTLAIARVATSPPDRFETETLGAKPVPREVPRVSQALSGPAQERLIKPETGAALGKAVRDFRRGMSDDVSPTPPNPPETPAD